MNPARAGRMLCATIACGMAVSSVTAGAQNSSAPPPTAAQRQVMDAEDRWVAAEQHHDAAALLRILDDKFVVSFGTERPVDKDSFIKAIVSADVDPTHSQTLSDRMVIVDHDTAVIVGTDTERGTKKGAAFTAVARYTATYIRRNEQWVALAEHLVEVPHGR